MKRHYLMRKFAANDQIDRKFIEKILIQRTVNVCKIYTNDDPWLILTNLTAMSNLAKCVCLFLCVALLAHKYQMSVSEQLVLWFFSLSDSSRGRGQCYTFEPRSEKTGLRGFRPGPTQTGLCIYRKCL